MYGKVMRLKDDLIIQYFTLATNTPLLEIETFKSRLNSNENPMLIKKELARVIVSELHNSESARIAAQTFESTIQDRQLPEEIPAFTVSSDNIIDILVETKLASSKSEARRLIDQGGIKIDSRKVTDYQIPVKSGSVISAGSRRFVKII